VVEQGAREVKNHFMPALKPLEKDLSEYDEIIIGTPTWWYDMAPAVLSFLSHTDFSGKKTAFFQTNAGWPGNCLKNMKEKAAGSEVIGEALITFRADSGHREKMTEGQQSLDDLTARL
jgi:flavorubredoxin